MNIIPFQFENKSIRVVTDENGEPLFVGKDICQALGFSNANQAMATHCKGIQKMDTLQTSGGKQELRVLAEPDVLRLIVNCSLPAAEKFERLVFEEILPSIRKTGSYSVEGNPNVPTKQYVDAAAAFIKHVTEDLKLAQSSVLGMYQKLEIKIGLQGLLPAYAVDASTSSVAGSSEPTAAASTLLKQFDVAMSTITFNKLLMQEGFLAEHSRPSSNGGTKKFKVVTNLEYGKNITSPTNPRETQPHWYVDKFPDLLEEVLNVELA